MAVSTLDTQRPQQPPLQLSRHTCLMDRPALLAAAPGLRQKQEVQGFMDGYPRWVCKRYRYGVAMPCISRQGFESQRSQDRDCMQLCEIWDCHGPVNGLRTLSTQRQMPWVSSVPAPSGDAAPHSSQACGLTPPLLMMCVCAPPAGVTSSRPPTRTSTTAAQAPPSTSHWRANCLASGAVAAPTMMHSSYKPCRLWTSFCLA